MTARAKEGVIWWCLLCMPLPRQPSLVLLRFAAVLTAAALPCHVLPISSPSMVSLLLLLHTFHSGKDCFSSAQHDRTSCFFSLLALPKLQEVIKCSYLQLLPPSSGLMAPTMVLQSAGYSSQERDGKWGQAVNATLGDASSSHSHSHIRKSTAPKLKSLTLSRKK